MAVRTFSKKQYIEILKQLGFSPTDTHNEYWTVWTNNKGRGILVPQSDEQLPYWSLDDALSDTPYQVTFSGELMRRDHKNLN